MLKAVIITDDQKQKEQFRQKVAALLPPGTQARSYSGREATNQDLQGDLFYVHTRLNRTNILDLVRKLKTTNPAAILSFISDNLEDADFVLNMPFTGFLWLQDTRDRLQEITKAMVAQFESGLQDHIAVRRRGRLHYVPKDEILYLERDYRKLIFHMTNGSPLVVYKPLEEILEEVGSEFVRVHNSFVIRITSVRQLSRDTLILKDQSQIPVSRTYINHAREVLNRLSVK